MQHPALSIIVPCYRQAEFLDECLASVTAQTSPDWECIIINDGSPDNTAEIAAAWCARDERFRYMEQPNGGLSAARNNAIREARGEYILPLDADDRIGPRYVELGLKALRRDKRVKVVYCYAEQFGARSGAWKLSEYRFNLLLIKNMIFCSAIYRRADWRRAGGYDVNMKGGLEDWELWINILQHGGRVVRLDSVQFFYRIKSVSMLTSLDKEAFERLEGYIYRKHRLLYHKILGNPLNFYWKFRYRKRKRERGLRIDF